LIRHITTEFDVNVIVVLGHERLYNDIVRRYDHKSGISVVRIFKSGGAVELNESYVQQLQNYRTNQYFYGDLKTILSPVSRTLDFKNIKVYRIAEGKPPVNPIGDIDILGKPVAHAAVLPVGQTEAPLAPELEIIQLQSPSVLQHSILAITNVGIDEDPLGVLETNVLGFIFVYNLILNSNRQSRSDADDARQKLTVLQPTKGNIANILIMGVFKWQDS
jgi:polyribonucleotide 5'-hydroxyl-kinase